MNKWTAKETSTLINNYNILTNDELKSLFPTRTLLGIYRKAYKLGLRKEQSIERINRSLCRQREKGSNWKGGRKTNYKGYIQVLEPNHHRADPSGYVFEHILVFEKETGITVTKDFVVHHLDGNKQNNDISNLCLMTMGGHTSFHNKNRGNNHE